MHVNRRHHRKTLEDIAYRAMLSRGLLPAVEERQEGRVRVYVAHRGYRLSPASSLT